jgi:hypothetical protein
LKKIDEKALKHFESRWCYGFLFGQKRTHKKQKAKSKKQNRLSVGKKSDINLKTAWAPKLLLKNNHYHLITTSSYTSNGC